MCFIVCTLIGRWGNIGGSAAVTAGTSVVRAMGVYGGKVLVTAGTGMVAGWAGKEAALYFGTSETMADLTGLITGTGVATVAGFGAQAVDKHFNLSGFYKPPTMTPPKGSTAGNSSRLKIGDVEISGRDLSKESIIEQLDGKTAQSTRIAQGLRDGDIKLNILGDELFNNALGAEDAVAVARGNQIYVRRSSASILTDVVHEGTHVLDFNNGFGAEGVSTWSWEKRAFFYERQFQIVTGAPIEHSTIEEMLMHIWMSYGNEIYFPY